MQEVPVGPYNFIRSLKKRIVEALFRRSHVLVSSDKMGWMESWELSVKTETCTHAWTVILVDTTGTEQVKAELA